MDREHVHAIIRVIVAAQHPREVFAASQEPDGPDARFLEVMIAFAVGGLDRAVETRKKQNERMETFK